MFSAFCKIFKKRIAVKMRMLIVLRGMIDFGGCYTTKITNIKCTFKNA